MTATSAALLDIAVHAVFGVGVLGTLLGLAAFLTWVERKQAAVMADRIGANRAYLRIPFTNVRLTLLGLFHGMADGLKMLLKENFKPVPYDRIGYWLAPWLAVAPILLVFAVVPFGGRLAPAELFSAEGSGGFAALGRFLGGLFGERSYPMQIADLDGGILVILAISGIGILGAILAGWSSNNKFSLLGASRAASQMISYEIVMGLSLLGIVVVFGTVDLNTIVRQQSGALFGVLPRWGIFLQPLTFLLFLTAAMAENKRVPFDLPECESELISGYFTEYSAMKMGLFMLSEFLEIVVISALITTFFLGGYNPPFMGDGGFDLPFYGLVALPHLPVVAIQVGTFVFKILLVSSLQIQVRWSLPRFRYDQLMKLGWKFLLPVALANLLFTVLGCWLFQGGGGG